MKDDTFLTILRKSAEDIGYADDVRDLERILHRATREIGFSTFNMGINKASQRDFMNYPNLTSWSERDLINYDRDGWYGRDPLLAYAASRKPPLTWSTQDWKTWGHDAYHEYVTASGVIGGLTIPMNNKDANLTAITFLNFTDSLPANNSVEAAFVLGSLLASRAVGIGAAERKDESAVRLKDLTARQIEVLRWVAEGKTNQEIAIILDLSTRNVEYHVAEAVRKLNVTNRIQASAIYLSR